MMRMSGSVKLREKLPDPNSLSPTTKIILVVVLSPIQSKMLRKFLSIAEAAGWETELIGWLGDYSVTLLLSSDISQIQ